MFTLPDLPYSYDALSPYMDSKTVEMHYTKHHQGYLDKLNSALEKVHSPISNIRELLINIAQYKTPEIRNNAGGFYNHTFFWKSMSANPSKEPRGMLKKQMIDTYGSISHFKEAFTKKASSLFGSGWSWFCVDKDRKFHIINTSNQDNPLMNYKKQPMTPLFGIDLWEHAYYLQYHNKRSDYITAFWHVLDWDIVSERYDAHADYNGFQS